MTLISVLRAATIGLASSVNRSKRSIVLLLMTSVIVVLGRHACSLNVSQLTCHHDSLGKHGVEPGGQSIDPPENPKLPMVQMILELSSRIERKVFNVVSMPCNEL